ncbi:serine hydrolase domain-containing protein [Devriesea agamarum]|uniref:serine hydrolase domain-containing protein n=1 Tax=Devriesea agamarum TaxID=472569 RepID=UPI00071CF541|nr:serine hydrolase domain-containing protein [Devriesea agamarum]
MEGQPISREAAVSACDYIPRWAEIRRQAYRLPGLQIAVWYDGDVILDEAQGIADLSTGTPLRTDHRFRLSAHTMCATAALTLMLCQDGLLELTDPVRTHLPETDGTACGDVILLELMTHMSGLARDGHDARYWNIERPFPDIHELMQFMTSKTARVIPRYAHFKFSNIGYALLGHVIERATGSSFSELLYERLLWPLSIENITADADERDAHILARGHTSTEFDEPAHPIEHVSAGALTPAVGMAGTAASTATLLGNLIHNQRLTVSLHRRLMTYRHWTFDEKNFYALGMQGIEEPRCFGHDGIHPGHTGRTWVLNDSPLAVTVFTNTITRAVEEIARGILDIFNIAAGSGQCVGALDQQSLKMAQRVSGRYRNMWETSDLIVLGDRLWRINPSLVRPSYRIEQLEVVDDEYLLPLLDNGYGYHGELVSFDDVDGRPYAMHEGAEVKIADEFFSLPDRICLPRSL